MSTLTIKDVRKSYGALEVVHGVSLDIADGEFVILVGPSGCGKSTLLRMIAGLEEITSGEVALDDIIINKLPPRRRDIAMVFQSYALYPHKTVRKNMAFSLQMSGAGAAEIKAKVDEAAKVLALEPLLDRKPAQLSGGQRQRVAMGRAIVRNPKLFLFDEPLSNLDAKLRVQMRSEIKELHQRLKTTTVYVTHDQVEAMTMADRIVVMNGGNIEQIGAPMDLYERPQTLFVAGFIGSPGMNLIEGALAPDGTFTSNAGLVIDLAESAPDVTTDQSIVLGIRPEDLTLGLGEIGLGDGIVRVSEPTGSETTLTTDTGGSALIVLDRTRRTFSAGDKMPLSVDARHLHYFDHATGFRMK
ncbi:sn-glycerol-3-phosphate ABC transporter ATP-binding protein UgpC [Gymnodinialimonas sp. 2305UL16-5]|uniref:ABC transporter ATP-binding protein n=1 Tax=Gymnodinialimonas mytili TaxID=3126503 RepID=UPI0030A84EFC